MIGPYPIPTPHPHLPYVYVVMLNEISGKLRDFSESQRSCVMTIW